ncbi:MAG: OsmC family protein [Solirubrobacteraceae bacterium]|jgi:putative redox protein
MSFSASARRIEDTLRHEVDVNGRHMIITDEPVALGGTDTGPAPHELLPATLASCIATMISMYARSKGWPLSGFSVDVEYDNESVPRHFEVAVNLPGGLAPEQIERLRRVADSCPVRRAMEAGFAFDEQIRIAPNPQAARSA